MINDIDAYCFNLMESLIETGAKGDGISKDRCIATLNLMLGARQYAGYIEEATINSERQEDEE